MSAYLQYLPMNNTYQWTSLQIDNKFSQPKEKISVENIWEVKLNLTDIGVLVSKYVYPWNDRCKNTPMSYE